MFGAISLSIGCFVFIILRAISYGDQNTQLLDLIVADKISVHIEADHLVDARTGKPLPDFQAIMRRYNLYDLQYTVGDGYPQYYSLRVPSDVDWQVVEREFRALPYIITAGQGGKRFVLPTVKSGQVTNSQRND